MLSIRHQFRTGALVVALVALGGSPAWAQGKGKERKPDRADEAKSTVTVELAVSAAKEVLIKQGFEVVRIETARDHQIIYYRAGNRGRGKGHGPPARMVIRRTDERVTVEEAPDGIRLEIGVKLGIKL